MTSENEITLRSVLPRKVGKEAVSRLRDDLHVGLQVYNHQNTLQ